MNTTIIKKGKFRLTNIIQLTDVGKINVRPISYGLALEVESENNDSLYYVVSFIKWEDNNIRIERIDDRLNEAVFTEEDAEAVLDLLMEASKVITAANLFN